VFARSALVSTAVVTNQPMWNLAWINSGLSNNDFATHEYCHIGFFWLGHIRAFSRMVATGGPKSIGLGARWGCPGGLGWFQAGGGTRRVGTRSSSSRRSQSTTGTRGVLCAVWAHGFQRFLCSLLCARSRGLGHLRGLTTQRGTLGRRIRVNILGHSAQRFTNYKLIRNEK
jgi:hypothetical protein